MSSSVGETVGFCALTVVKNPLELESLALRAMKPLDNCISGSVWIDNVQMVAPYSSHDLVVHFPDRRRKDDIFVSRPFRESSDSALYARQVPVVSSHDQLRPAPIVLSFRLVPLFNYSRDGCVETR